MLSRLKQYAVLAVFVGVFYFFLSHHVIFTSFKDFDVLEKDGLTFKYTFFSLKQTTPQEVLRIDELRDAGIGDVLVERELISNSDLEKLLAQINAE